MRKEAKKNIFSFAKTSENEAKQDAFRFISRKLKKNEKGTPYGPPPPQPFLTSRKETHSWWFGDGAPLNHQWLDGCVRGKKNSLTFSNSTVKNLFFYVFFSCG
jgi:hypothetical protein